jgi:hypothetical protein
MSPQPPPRSCISCCSPQVSCVWGTPDQISDDEVPIPCLHVTSPSQPSAHAAAPSPADRDDEVPIPRFSHHTALVSCYSDAEIPPALRYFLPFILPLPSYCSPSTCRLPAAADALSGRMNSDLLLLLLLPPPLYLCLPSACPPRLVADAISGMATINLFSPPLSLLSVTSSISSIDGTSESFV